LHIPVIAIVTISTLLAGSETTCNAGESQDVWNSACALGREFGNVLDMEMILRMAKHLACTCDLWQFLCADPIGPYDYITLHLFQPHQSDADPTKGPPNAQFNFKLS